MMESSNDQLTIELLGTAAAWPFPRIGCPCDMCCEAAEDPSQRRTRSAALVGLASREERVLIDAGPDIHWQLLRAGDDVARKIVALVLSHPHSDHFLGLDDLGRSLKDVREDLLPFFLLPDNLSVVRRTFGFLLPSQEGAREWEKPRFEPRFMDLEESFEVGGLVFTPFDTYHTEEFTTAGFRIEGAGSTVVYAPDCARIESEIPRGADLFILDATEFDESTESHLSIESAVDLAERFEARRIALTHIGHHQVASTVREERIDGRAVTAIDGMRWSL